MSKPKYQHGVCIRCKLYSITILRGACQSCRDEAQLTLRVY